jgi:uncharacterized protein YegP (UPF0339 family)
MKQERLEIKRNASTDQKQVWFWHWKAGNNEIIATSGEPFYSQYDAVKAATRINDKLAHPLVIDIVIEG